MSGGEIVVIVFVALLLFGSKAIPDVARTLGKAMREFQKATNEIKREINEAGGLGDEIRDLKTTINGAKSDIEQGIRTHTNDIQSNLDEIEKDVKKGTDDLTTTLTKEAKTE